MSWRSEAALIIGEVIRRVGLQDMTALRKELAEAYPWGARKLSLQGLVGRDSPSVGPPAE
nr:hypothetical protein pPsy0479b_00008 [Pseudomonas syringae]